MVVVTTWAECLSLYRMRLSLECVALGLIALLVSSRVLSTPQVQTDPSARQRIRPTPLRLLLEWSTVSALVAFLGTALKYTQLFPRGALPSWLVITPAALLASNYGAIYLTRWWTSRRGLRRHIIIGATEIGLELAKRIERDNSTFLGFFDFRDRRRLPQLVQKR